MHNPGPAVKGGVFLLIRQLLYHSIAKNGRFALKYAEISKHSINCVPYIITLEKYSITFVAHAIKLCGCEFKRSLTSENNI